MFVMTAGMVEAHIQIQYKGEAAKFSWILPVQAQPEVEVGAEALFTRLLQATVPTFSFQRVFDNCGATTGFSSQAAAFVRSAFRIASPIGGPPLRRPRRWNRIGLRSFVFGLWSLV